MAFHIHVLLSKKQTDTFPCDQISELLIDIFPGFLLDC